MAAGNREEVGEETVSSEVSSLSEAARKAYDLSDEKAGERERVTIEDIHGKALAVAGGFLHDPKKAGFVAVPVPDLDRAIEEKDFSELIEDLHVAADHKMNVKRYKRTEAVGILGTAPPVREDVLIRDARYQKEDQPIKNKDNISESYMMSVANTARGAMRMIDESDLPSEEKAKLKKQFQQETARALRNIRELDSEEGLGENKKRAMKLVRGFEKVLLKELTESGMSLETPPNDEGKIKINSKNALKILADMRDAENLRDPQPHIVTVSEPDPGGPPMVEAAIRAKPFSKDQAEELRKIRDFYQEYGTYNSKKISKEEKEGAGLPKWFKDLKPHQQRTLCTNLTDEVLDGKKTIPTSLRYFPGLRNAYFEVSMVKEPEKAPEIINANFRVATPAFFVGKSKATRKEVTEANLEHYVGLAKHKNGKIRKVGLQIYNPPSFAGEIAATFGIFKSIAEENTIASTLGEVTKTGELAKNIHFRIVRIQTRPNRRAMVDEMLDTGKEAGVEFDGLSCKSGKDRTGFAAKIRPMLKYIEKFLKGANQEKKVKIAVRTEMAGHGSELAGGYGGNHGSLAKKIHSMHEFAKINIFFAFGKYKFLAHETVREVEKSKVSGLNKIAKISKVQKIKSSLARAGKAITTTANRLRGKRIEIGR